MSSDYDDRYRLMADLDWQPEINRELVLSMEHITTECSRWLQASYERDVGGCDDMRMYVNQVFDSGYRIWIPTEKDYKVELLMLCENNGYRYLARMLMVAISYNCKYLVICADGEACPFLETFDW